jgi:hypothetical protein
MSNCFRNQEFRSVYDRDSSRVFEGYEFEECHFVSCALSITLDPAKRTTIRYATLQNCEVRGCSMWAAILEEVVVNGFKTNGLFQTWGAVFKHVTLKGKIDRVMFSPTVAVSKPDRKHQVLFDEVNAGYYASLDWALDIREGLFGECEIQGVPAHLVIRDPETQVIVTRAKAARGEWRRLDLSKTHWATSLEFFLERGERDVVLVAPKRHKNFKQLVDGLMHLRNAGVAEPD